jgi:hypothetical protein
MFFYRAHKIPIFELVPANGTWGLKVEVGGVDLNSSSKTQQSCFCSSFLIIPNLFLQHYFLHSLRSRVGRLCQSTTQILHGIVWAWHRDPLAFAGLCRWQKWLAPTYCSILSLYSRLLASLLLMLLLNLFLHWRVTGSLHGHFRPLWVYDTPVDL